jgi:hypothetical protein
MLHVLIHSFQLKTYKTIPSLHSPCMDKVHINTFCSVLFLFVEKKINMNVIWVAQCGSPIPNG